MSEAVWCRLCLNTCNDYRSIYDETGHYNAELYEVTIKYFHPTILTAMDGKPQTVMCLGCWRQISEFHKFHNDILAAQEQLIAKATTVTRIKVSVKNEFLDITDEFSTRIENQCSAINVKNETEFLPLSHLELKKSDHTMTRTTSANIDPLLPNREVRKIKDVEIHDTEYDDEVGTFPGGEFNNIDESLSFSLSEEESIKLEFSVDDETPSTSNPIKRSSNEFAASGPNEDLTDEDTLKKNSISNDAFIAKWLPTLNCPLCQRSCGNFGSLDKHFRECHPNERSFVECCQRKFSKRYLLADHVCAHLDPNRLSCKLCNQFFRTKCSLRRHNILQHPKSKETLNYDPKPDMDLDFIVARWKPNLECAICKESYSSLTLLQRHFKRNHHNEAFHIFCCQRKLTMMTHIRAHALRHVPELEPIDTVISSEPVRSCNICGKTFRHSVNFRKHINAHTGYFQCPYCYHAYRTTFGVLRHVKKVHPEKNTIPISELMKSYVDPLQCP